MTQFLSLLNQAFGYQTKGNDLEQYINSRNPNSHEQVEQFTRDYFNPPCTSKGL
jgi:hypothetical protein